MLAVRPKVCLVEVKLVGGLRPVTQHVPAVPKTGHLLVAVFVARRIRSRQLSVYWIILFGADRLNSKRLLASLVITIFSHHAAHHRVVRVLTALI